MLACLACEFIPNRVLNSHCASLARNPCFASTRNLRNSQFPSRSQIHLCEATLAVGNEFARKARNSLPHPQARKPRFVLNSHARVAKHVQMKPFYAWCENSTTKLASHANQFGIWARNLLAFYFPWGMNWHAKRCVKEPLALGASLARKGAIPNRVCLALPWHASTRPFAHPQGNPPLRIPVANSCALQPLRASQFPSTFPRRPKQRVCSSAVEHRAFNLMAAGSSPAVPSTSRESHCFL